MFVNSSNSVKDCKKQICDKEDIPESQQSIMGKIGRFEDHWILSDCLFEGETLYLILTLRGGGHKKGKKEISKKEKIPVGSYYAHHDGHGFKHVLPFNDNLNIDKKKDIIKNTKHDTSMFYPNIVHTRNYAVFVEQCVKKWVENGAKKDDQYVECGMNIGADQGQETKRIAIYLSDVGAHVRPSI